MPSTSRRNVGPSPRVSGPTSILPRPSQDTRATKNASNSAAPLDKGPRYLDRFATAALHAGDLEIQRATVARDTCVHMMEYIDMAVKNAHGEGLDPLFAQSLGDMFAGIVSSQMSGRPAAAAPPPSPPPSPGPAKPAPIARATARAKTPTAPPASRHPPAPAAAAPTSWAGVAAQGHKEKGGDAALSPRPQPKGAPNKQAKTDNRLFVRIEADTMAELSSIQNVRLLLQNAGVGTDLTTKCEAVKSGVAIYPASSAAREKLVSMTQSICAALKGTSMESNETWQCHRAAHVPSWLGGILGLPETTVTKEMVAAEVKALTGQEPAKVREGRVIWETERTWIIHMRTPCPPFRIFSGPKSQIIEKKSPIVQCTNCWDYHPARNCVRPNRCGGCTQQVVHGDCAYSRCANCLGPHTANDLKCPCRPHRKGDKMVRVKTSEKKKLRAAGAAAWAKKYPNLCPKTGAPKGPKDAAPAVTTPPDTSAPAPTADAAETGTEATETSPEVNMEEQEDEPEGAPADAGDDSNPSPDIAMEGCDDSAAAEPRTGDRRTAPDEEPARPEKRQRQGNGDIRKHFANAPPTTTPKTVDYES